MKKIILCLTILLILTGCSNNNKEIIDNKTQINVTNDSVIENNITITAVPTLIPTIIPETINKVNVEDNDLLNNLEVLSNSPRRFDTDGEKRALSFLVDKMNEYGYQTQTQEFNVYKRTFQDLNPRTLWQYFDKYSGDEDRIGTGKNVIVKTANPEKKKTLYITAHYDTTSDTNGIRDNGSGVVTAMEIARQLQGINLPINLEFIFFSAEEVGMQGSSYFVSQLNKEDKDNALGCINIDVVGQKGDNEVELKTFFTQINVLSLLIDEYNKFPCSSSELSDHTSFYMGEIPVISFSDKNVETKDSSDNPLDEIDIDKIKELTQIICDFIIDFNLDKYNDLIRTSYTKEYIDLPKTDEVAGYSLIQVNKVLKNSGAGSDTQYILQNDVENKIVMTETDIRFLDEKLIEEIQTFDTYNDHVKYKVKEEYNGIIVQYMDNWLFYYDVLKGDISKDEAIELLNNQSKFTINSSLLYKLD